MYENMEMRKVYSAEMEKLMAENDKIVYFDADLAKGIGTLNLNAKFPERAINVGIAEQNMTAIAAGMSSYGFIPFITSFTPFVTRRACDQIAISCLYAQQNVKIVGSDPGIAAQTNGGTHMSMEDIGVMRSIPNMVISEPCDATELVKALPKIIEYQGTMYIRLWRKELPAVYADNYNFELFKASTIKKGKDVTLYASGFMVSQAVQAAEILEKENISAEILNVHTIKPIDEDSVVASAEKTGAAVTCDNHNFIGGLGSAVMEALAHNYPVPVESIGVKDRFGQVGDVKFLAEEYQLMPQDIVRAAKKAIARKG